MNTTEFQEVLQAEPVSIKLVKIPSGSFLMGSPPEEQGHRLSNYESPQHLVTLESFWMSHTPITQDQWRLMAAQPKVKQTLNPDPSYFKGQNRPVEQVSLHDAIEFCHRLSQYTGRHYTLPSEAQWEYACRAGTTTPFHFGATLTSELANYPGNCTYAQEPKGPYRQETTDVASFPANPWGLHDMHGNVLEWCLDQWHRNYGGAPTDGSAWVNMNVVKNDKRMLRGGSWGSFPGGCRSACRSHLRPGDVLVYVGLRVVCTADLAEELHTETCLYNGYVKELVQEARTALQQPAPLISREDITSLYYQHKYGCDEGMCENGFERAIETLLAHFGHKVS